MPRKTTTTATTTATTATTTTTATLRLQPVDDTPTSSSTHDRSQSPKSGDKKCVTWTEDVVDNENLGRKKTKICCIFHPQNEEEFEVEGDSDSSSSSGSSSSSSSDESDAEPNAYERQPRYKRKVKDSNCCNSSIHNH